MSAQPIILVIDDEPINRDVLEILLSGEELTLLFAENGEDGLAMAWQHQPDAVLLDVMMPGIDGYEVCQRLRANPSYAEIPIIMITALDDRASRLAGLRAGADDFLLKPFDALELQIQIKNILRIKRLRDLIASV